MRSVWIMPILVMIFITASASAIPFEEWNRTYRDASFNDVLELSDGGYVLAGSKTSIGRGLLGAYLIKTDSNGNEEWNKLFAHGTYVSIVEKTIDGGYILGGHRTFIGDYGSKEVAFVIKTDSSGNEQWNRTFDENIDEYYPFFGGINSIQQTNDEGYIIAESRTWNDLNYARIFKHDPAGNIEWVRAFENSILHFVHQTPDDAYILSISPGNYIERSPGIKLKKFDVGWNELWNRTYKGMYGRHNINVELTDEGGYIISGEVMSGDTNIDALLIKTDANGNMLWNKTFGGTGDDGFNSIQTTGDGGYILAGYTGADHSADLLNFYYGDAWLLKVDAEGNKQWDMVFGNLEMKQIHSVRKTNDGGYIFTGRSGSNPSGSWVVKLTNDTAVPDNSPARETQNKFTILWTKIYNDRDAVYALRQGKDGGIVLTGVNYTNNQAFLMKTDNSGKELWNNTFSWRNNERSYMNQFNSIDETMDGGYILGGMTVYNAYGVYDAWLVKTDREGKELWNRTIGSKDANEHISVVRAQDDGYVVAINVIPNNFQEVPEESWFIKTDLKGNQLWIKRFNGTIKDFRRDRDRGYILTTFEFGGWGYKDNTTPPTGWIIRTDESGSEMWKRSFGEYPFRIVTPNSVLQTGDGGYIVVGDYSDNFDHIQDAWVKRYDQTGNETWRKIIKSRSGGLDQSYHSVVETDDGGYIIGGKINMYRTTGVDANLIKVDSSGNELWNMTAGGDGNQVVNSMQQTSDGGLIFAGSMRNLDTEGRMSAMVMKVGKRQENNANTNQSNESLPEIRNNSQKLAPSSGFFIAVLSIIILFLLKRRR
ncbi:MAG: hypothetical protein OIN88_03075 [Candidatus Methanoperedens sp.]|nr:hypothetical protein [Candidatus Methanoperedens sp.]MCZ7359458.1 hypothetical protein [Candidatus Methanoperedens sp.]HLB71609.1 hypothetical protein [Candidatus Methanoperedens sp.]